MGRILASPRLELIGCCFDEFGSPFRRPRRNPTGFELESQAAHTFAHDQELIEV